MMKDPEVRKEVLGDSKDEELEELLKDLDINDDDTVETIAKKSDAKVKKLINYFKKEMANVSKKTEEKASEDRKAQEDKKIQAFAAKNPGMNNTKVIALMQPLYDSGSTLEEAYESALKDLGIHGKELDPKTGEAVESPTEKETREAKLKEKEAKKAKKQEGAKSSAKSGVGEDDDDDGGDADDKDKGPVSLDDALAAASADYTAKHGNPFEPAKD